MSIKAKLRIVLHAGDTVVAESEDSALWQRVLAAINQPEQGAGSAPGLPPALDSSTGSNELKRAMAGDVVERFAFQLGVDRDSVEGACAPTTEAPYLHLDHHAWEDMKSNTPPRGPGAVPPVTMAATLLTLWFRAAGLGNPTVKMVHEVLGTIDLRDKNSARAIQGTEWLQSRGGAIVLNPAKVSRAVALAKAFCSRDWTSSRS